jgi:hypothetical protein
LPGTIAGDDICHKLPVFHNFAGDFFHNQFTTSARDSVRCHYTTQYVGITGKVSIPDTRFQAQASLSVTRLFDSYTN